MSIDAMIERAASRAVRAVSEIRRNLSAEPLA